MRIFRVFLFIVLTLILASIVFSQQGPTFEAVNTTNPYPTITVSYSEPVTLTAYLSSGVTQYNIIISSSDNITFQIVPEQYLVNGEYSLYLFATDRLGNPQTTIQPIIIDAPYMLIWVDSPHLGVSSQEVFDVTVLSENNAACTYSFGAGSLEDPSSNYPLPYPFEDIGNAHFLYDVNGESPIQLRRYSPDFIDENTRGRETNIFVLCKDEHNLVHPKEIYLAYDDTPPSLGVFITPNPITDIEHYWAELNITTNDRSICTYNNIGFPGYDENDFFAYKKEHSVILDYIDIAMLTEDTGLFDLYEFYYNVSCKNLAGLESSQNDLLITVHFEQDFSITMNSPEEYTSADTTYFEIETSVKTPQGCSIIEEDSETPLTTSDNIHYSLNLGALDEGEYSYEVLCGTSLGSRTETFTFTADRIPPTNLTIVAESPTCSLVSIEAEVQAKDSGSGIKGYNYTLVKVSDIITSGSSQGTISILSQLDADTAYTLIVTAYDKAGNPVQDSINILAIPATDTECDTTNPITSLGLIPTAEGTKVNVVCQDAHSGCTDTFDYGTTLEGESCSIISTESYDSYILLENTSTFCWAVYDLNYNNASGEQLVEVMLVNETYPDKCFNEVKDENETDVDCGGECPPCEDLGSYCEYNEDCITNSCNPEINECTEASCENERMDGDETDIDCGGTCIGCEIGEDCETDLDCDSQNCFSGVCAINTNQDSDGDGMPDYWEEQYDLDPNNASDAFEDPDEDTYVNLEEFKADTNPQDSESHPIDKTKDSDRDGMPDYWEEKYGLEPLNARDANEDPDNDGYDNLEEYRADTNPKDSESHPKKGGEIPRDITPPKNVLPLILIIIGIILVLSGAVYLVLAYKKPKKELEEARLVDEKGRMPEAEERPGTEEERKELSLKEKLFKKREKEKEKKRKEVLDTFEEEVKKELKELETEEIETGLKKPEEEKEELLSKPEKEKKEEYVDVSELKKEPEFKEEDVGKDVFQKLGAIAEEETEKETQSSKAASAPKGKLLSEKKEERKPEKEIIEEGKKEFPELEPVGEEKKAEEEKEEDLSTEDVFKKLAELAQQSHEKVKKTMDKEKVSTGDLMKVFANVTSKKQIDANVFKAILSQLLKKEKLSKQVVTEILFEFLDEELLTEKEVAEILKNLNLVPK